MLNLKLKSIAASETDGNLPNEKKKTEKAKVLFLDDEERILNSLRAIFRFKYEVYSTTSGQDALNILKEHDISVVVSDQRMPNMTGIEFLRLAKQVSPATMRILLTGFSDLQAVIDSVNDGEVFRFLNKPWGNREILAIVDEAASVYDDVKQMTPALPPASSQTSAAGASVPGIAVLGERNKVLVKCHSSDLFHEIQKAALPSMELVHAPNQLVALDVLQQYPVSVMVTHLDEKTGRAEDELDFLKLLKRELPGLMTVGMVESADYEEIISLINEAKLYRYAVLPTKASRIVFFVESALHQAKLLKQNPVLLRQQSVEKKLPLKEAYGQTGKIMAKIGAIRKLFGRWGGV